MNNFVALTIMTVAQVWMWRSAHSLMTDEICPRWVRKQVLVVSATMSGLWVAAVIVELMPYI